MFARLFKKSHSRTHFALKNGVFVHCFLYSGADVVVTYKGRSAAAALGKAGEVALKGTTDSDGRFNLGPLYDDVSYAAEVSRPGYEFSLLSEEGHVFKFAAKKQAQVGGWAERMGVV